VPNKACALLFAKEPQDVVPGAFVRIQRYRGTKRETGDRRNVIEDVQIHGTVPEIIDACRKRLGFERDLNRIFRRLDKDGRFTPVREYPPDAVHELIVNACVHRSYNLGGSNVWVRIFDDRLEVESPGDFPGFVTAENIYDTQCRRNFWLMDALSFLDYVLCENEGVRRVRDEMRKLGLPDPSFEQRQISEATVRVTLRNDVANRDEWVDAEVSEIVGANLAAGLNTCETRIIRRIADKGSINVRQAQRLCDVNDWGAMKRRLMRLVEKGLLIQKCRTDIQRDPKARFVLNPEIMD
jgi:ATP-dependent DNA helicase RecG